MEKYAILIKDSEELFLFLNINRTVHGDVYVNFNENHPSHKPHSSYHASGQLHHKSSRQYLFPIRKLQQPNKNFNGSESIIVTSIREGAGRAWDIKCNPMDYTEVMIIPNEIIIPEFGFQFNVEIVDANKKSWASTYPYAKVIEQQIFHKNEPWIVVSLYECLNRQLISDV